VVPHGALHRIPLYLDADAQSRDRTVILPSASMLRGRARRDPSRLAAVVAGNPSQDLPFAGVECEIAAARLGVVPCIGAGVTYEWLAGQLSGDPRPRVVHLACHGYFDEYRAQRSGLVLAGPDGGRLATLAELAEIDWSGVLAVLSACESGEHEVRTGDELAGITQTILAAGAAATLTALRPVPDSSTALLMSWFYEELDPSAGWQLDDICGALSNAQRRMRSITAAELVGWAADVAGHGPAQLRLAAKAIAAAHRAAGQTGRQAVWEDHAAALLNGGSPVTAAAVVAERKVCAGPVYATRQPYAAPRHWAPFCIQGAGWVG
jgi:CHAT domain-containing protein